MRPAAGFRTQHYASESHRAHRCLPGNCLAYPRSGGHPAPHSRPRITTQTDPSASGRGRLFADVGSPRRRQRPIISATCSKSRFCSSPWPRSRSPRVCAGLAHPVSMNLRRVASAPQLHSLHIQQGLPSPAVFLVSFGLLIGMWIAFFAALSSRATCSGCTCRRCIRQLRCLSRSSNRSLRRLSHSGRHVRSAC